MDESNPVFPSDQTYVDMPYRPIVDRKSGADPF